MIIMIKHKVVALFVLAAIMFVLTNQDELIEDFTEDNTRCPHFDSSGFTGWDDKHRWCPPLLARAMKQICRGKYNAPPETYQQTRRKRQIMEECCRHCCTARYLKYFYCNDSSLGAINALVLLSYAVYKCMWSTIINVDRISLQKTNNYLIVDNRKLYIPPISNEDTEIYRIYDDN